MIDTIRNLAIDYQDWASSESLSYSELGDWQYTIGELARLADPSGELTKELKENGIHLIMPVKQ